MDIEKHLLMQINNGDESAFKELFIIYRDRLFNYVFKVTKSREISEEIVMDVFLKLWDGKALVMEIENFPAFIFSIARNKSIDFLRKAAKDKILQELIWNEVQMRDDVQSDDLVIVNDLKRELNVAVEKLSSQRRAVYKLSREEDMSYDQIAKHLHLSKNTIKNHIVASLRLIRIHLDTKLGLIITVLFLMKKYFHFH